ncbi:MAG: iron ABC transporter substrate-binding protein, partial [Oscillospiraceae bacterium]|nr:iron ABC transporter substrate-binding protein [Oscillospiraceae bacterium]
MKKIISIVLASLMLIALFAGCADTHNGNSENDIAQETVVFDNYGREAVIKKNPQKVLTLGPNCTELFAALGLSDKVIGRSLINHSRGPLPEYADAVNAIPQLNYAEATREAILTSGANFIYAIDWEISDAGCNIDEAKSYGMDVYVNSATTPEEQYKEILDIGKIFGIEERAEAFVAD